MIDVLMLTAKDLSNMAWRFSNCLKLLDLNVQVFKQNKHMNYGDEVPTLPMKFLKKTPLVFTCFNLRKLARNSKVLHFTSGTFIDTGVNVKNKIVVLQYGGRPFVGFRNKRKACIRFFNTFVNYTIVHHPFMLQHGANNCCFIKPPVETDKLLPVFERQDLKKIIIGHFPSYDVRKGTKVIMKVLENLKASKFGNQFEYIIETERVPWHQQLERIKKCDVIIECLTPVVGDDKFGEWSTATLESAALGKITVTNSFHEDIYEKTYGPSEICIANDPTQLRKVLVQLINMTPEQIQDKKIKTREWVVRCHSMEATAILLWEKVYKHIFPDRRPKLIYEKEKQP